MPALVYRYLPGKLLKLQIQETDDIPTILGELNPTESVASQRKADRDESNFTPSNDVRTRVNRQKSPKMKLVRLARTHCAALSACEDGFPGYARQEVLVQRAMRRAAMIIHYPKDMLTDNMKEMVLGAIGELHRRLLTAAEGVIEDCYFPNTFNRRLTPTEAFALVSSLVVDDNFIYETTDTHGKAREGPFRHRAIAQTFSKVVFGDTARDLYNFHAYFYPVVPHFFIVLICTALRCALDQMWTGEYVAREFSRDLYGEVLHSLSFRWVCLDPYYARETQQDLATQMQDTLVTSPISAEDNSSDADEEEPAIGEPPLKRTRLLF